MVEANSLSRKGNGSPEVSTSSAILLCTSKKDESEYPMLQGLPSYGDTRFASLIYGRNLTDIVITGDKGIINGQGKSWWAKYRNGGFKSIQRPMLIEIESSKNVQISNINLFDAPTWSIHPVYCRNVIIKDVKISNPIDSPNTDGINPDSCVNTLVEDCFVISGNDGVGLKSGIAVVTAIQMLMIRRLSCIAPNGAGVALGSEVSGGISGVRIEDVNLYNTQSAVKFETAVDGGGNVQNVWARRFMIKTSKYVFLMIGSHKSVPRGGYTISKSKPIVTNINFRDIRAENVTTSAKLQAMKSNPFTSLCMSNVSISLYPNASKQQFHCVDIVGKSKSVTPQPCSLLPDTGLQFGCTFPTEKICIENVVLKRCRAHIS